MNTNDSYSERLQKLLLSAGITATPEAITQMRDFLFQLAELHLHNWQHEKKREHDFSESKTPPQAGTKDAA